MKKEEMKCTHEYITGRRKYIRCDFCGKVWKNYKNLFKEWEKIDKAKK